MIHGIGVDIVEIERIAYIYNRYKERFLHRILHTQEYSSMPTTQVDIFLASRFAVKEAFVKALGTGFRDGISFRDIATVKDKLGSPRLLLDGIAKEYYDSLGIHYAHLSLSHEASYTVAMIILER
ncbi:MAG: holo-ACP synthase [Desulfovibrionaceae bacterium]|nr:holo-ACP synthase [Desulfovibrionaceae bacterium]